MDIQSHGPSIGQNQFNIYFDVSVPADVSYADAERAIDQKCHDWGYYGGRIDGIIPSTDGRQHYRVAAHKE